MNSNSNADHLGFLDGLRGFLAFWVLFYHISMSCIAKSPPWGTGAIAVDIFMLLSGFLMAYHWKLRKGQFESFRSQLIDFYIRRFFRIAPLYYLLLTVALLGHDYFFEMRGYIKDVVPPPWSNEVVESLSSVPELDVFNVLAHYTFLFGLIPDYLGTNILPDWSITLEMQFYLFFPLLMLIISRFGPFSVVLSIIVVTFLTNKLVGLYLSPGALGNFPQPSLILFKINIFAAGISIAFININKNSVVGLFWTLLTILSLFNAKPQVWLVAIFIIVMLMFNNKKQEVLGRLLSSRIVKFFGDTSYSVYLVHVMIYVPILYSLFQYEWFMSLGDYYKLAVAFLLTLVPVYTVSYILYVTVELRGIDFGRRILRRRREKGVSAQSNYLEQSSI